MYFKNFPDIVRNFSINDTTVVKLLKDITTNVRFRTSILANITLFDEYDLREGDTPENLAAQYYGSSEYHWIIMLANQSFNWVEDFPLTQKQLEDVIVAKYALPHGIHHYEDLAGNIISAEQFPQVEITNSQYEDTINEQKRRIKLIAPSLVSKIALELKNML